MRRMSLRLFVCSLAMAVSASTGQAQSEPSPGAAPPFHVAFVERSATLVRTGEGIPLGPGEPLVDGDRLQTASGRVELRGPDGERIFLDQGSIFDVLQPPVFRLVTGAARVVLETGSRPDGLPAVEIDTPHGTAALFEAGDYRVSVLRRSGGEEAELIVRAGRGEVINAYGRVPVAERQRVAMTAFGEPSLAETLAVDDLVDSFDRWVDQALTGTRPTESAAYLPTGLASYSAVLDAAGSWSYEPTYGHVWYPTVVASWQPYYYGFWRPLGYYGYTWVSHTPWAWATHHYGRWGFGVGGWFWIPGAAWGSAWVSWGVGPGYVAWCPLGWGNRPVHPAPFALGSGRWLLPRAGYGSRHVGRPGGSWTLLRADHFRGGRPVSNHALDWRAVAPRQRAAFVEQQAPPRMHLAVARGSLAASTRTRDPGPAPLGTRLAAPARGDGVMSSATSPRDRVAGGRSASADGRSGSAPPTARAGVPTAGRRTVGDSAAVEGAYRFATPRASVPGRTRSTIAAPVSRSSRSDGGLAVRGSPRGSDEEAPSTPTARPRWIPPTTRYGIPPAGDTGRSANPQGLAPTPSEVPRARPGYTRSGGVGRTGEPRSSPAYAPPTVQRGSRPAVPRGSGLSVPAQRSPRAPAMSGPAARPAAPRAPASRPSGSGLSRPQSAGAGPARGQAAPRGGSSRRPPG